MIFFSFQNLMIQENCSGTDSAEYQLSCRLSCGDQLNIPTYTIPFIFYNGELLAISRIFIC